MFLQVCRRLCTSALSFRLKLREGDFGFKLKIRVVWGSSWCGGKKRSLNISMLLRSDVSARFGQSVLDGQVYRMRGMEMEGILKMWGRDVSVGARSSFDNSGLGLLGLSSLHTEMSV